MGATVFVIGCGVFASSGGSFRCQLRRVSTQLRSLACQPNLDDKGLVTLVCETSVRVGRREASSKIGADKPPLSNWAKLPRSR